MWTLGNLPEMRLVWRNESRYVTGLPAPIAPVSELARTETGRRSAAHVPGPREITMRELCLGLRIHQSALVPRQPSCLRCVWVLRAVAKQMIRQHAGHHRLSDRHRADAHAWIVPAAG